MTPGYSRVTGAAHVELKIFAKLSVPVTEGGRRAV